MKKSLIFCGLLFLSISVFGYFQPQLLEDLDIQFEQLNNSEGPALAAPLDNEERWESYNEWQCFPLSGISLDCATYDYNTRLPSIRVETLNHTYLFDTHVDDKLPCEQTLLKWEKLGYGGQEICIFAAQMPNVDFGMEEGDKPQSLWYISRIKFNGGYWDLVTDF